MNKLEFFREKIKEKKFIESALEVLQWDLETKTPKKGKEHLSEVAGYLSLKAYEIMTSKEMGEIIEKLEEDKNNLDAITKKEIENICIDIEKMKNIPPKEYQEYCELVSVTQGIWQEAREKNDYNLYRGNLKKIFDFTIKFANYNRKNEKNLYDVVLQDYERGMSCEKLDEFFALLKSEILPLLEKIKNKKNFEKKLMREVPIKNQKKFNKFICEYLGFDLERGVTDESAHPFTMNITKNDVRFTTRYIVDNPFSSVFSTIHEAGHGIYEQQIGDELQNTALAGGGTMGIHESQSRFYENILGRNIDFWEGIYTKLQEDYPIVKDMELSEFYKLINVVEPSFIRTEADELTYCLHIMVRYELEKELINQEITVDELPRHWNEKMKKYLGIVPENDAIGVMQDVHWSAGLIGYFPSYALGSVYASQIYNSMKKELDFSKILKNGDLAIIKNWLGEKIHRYGKLKDTNEIIKEVTGEELNPKYYVEYLKEKYSAIYDL